MSNEITVRLADLDTNDYTVAIRDEAVIKRDSLLAKAAEIAVVNDLTTQQQATGVVAELKGLSAAIEKRRKEVKQPFLTTGNLIDETAKKFIIDVDVEITRIERKIGAFVAEQQRLERERKAEQDRARIAAEAAAAAAQAALDAAEAALEDTTDAEIAAAEAADTAAEVAAQVHVEPEPVKVKGGSVSERIEYVVTDLDAFILWDINRRVKARDKGRTLTSFLKVTIAERDFKQYLKMISGVSDEDVPGIIYTTNTKVAINAAKL